MAHWEKAPDRVIKLTQDLISKYHPGLKEARIGVLIRSEPAASKGRLVFGTAETVNDKWRALLGGTNQLQFIISLARPAVAEWIPKKLAALIDHELCHCYIDDNHRPRILGHDIEEFEAIVRRHGLWNCPLEDIGKAIRQLPLQLIRQDLAGGVFSPDPRSLLDQVADEFNKQAGGSATATVTHSRRRASLDQPEAAGVNQ